MGSPGPLVSKATRMTLEEEAGIVKSALSGLDMSALVCYPFPTCKSALCSRLLLCSHWRRPTPILRGSDATGRSRVALIQPSTLDRGLPVLGLSVMQESEDGCKYRIFIRNTQITHINHINHA